MNMERRTIKRFKNSQSNHSIFQKVSPHRAREFCKSEAECEKEGDPEVVRCDGGVFLGDYLGLIHKASSSFAL